MKFGIFYEHQLPRPWESEAEHKLLKDALEQVELADRIGIDSVWEVEHHFLEEYSHSSAPEVFLAAASQRTTSSTAMMTWNQPRGMFSPAIWTPGGACWRSWLKETLSHCPKPRSSIIFAAASSAGLTCSSPISPA